MFGGTNNIIQNILHIQFECEEYSTAFPLNIVMDLNNVMEVGACVFFYFVCGKVEALLWAYIQSQSF